MKTEGILTSSPGAPFTYTKLELDDDLRDDEVHVHIRATGICHTDVKFSQEKSMADMFPCVFGHEGAGIVQRVGPGVTAVRPGDYVICVFSCCGECQYCQRRETGYCDVWFQLNFGMGRLDGSKALTEASTGERVTSHFFGQSSFARDVYVKETGLVVVEDRSVPFEMLAPLACGIMTGAGAMLNVVKPEKGMNLCVVGTGSVGLAAIMALGLLPKERRPKRVIAVDVVPSRLELARRMGATHGVNAKIRKNLMETLMEITDGEGVHGSIDLTGQGNVIQSLVHACARKGTVVTVGTGGVQGEVTLNLFEMVQAGCKYVGCQQGDCYPQEFLPMLIQAHKDGKFPYDKIVKTYPVKEVQSAIDDMEAGGTIKPVLIWD